MRRPPWRRIDNRVALWNAVGPCALAGALLLLTLAAGSARADAEETRIMPTYEGTVEAPEFPAGLDWLNVGQSLRLADLRGKVVLLDFWTYCCINCMHVIPDLKRLEAKYADELVVIGVHSAKFTTERETDNIRQAIARYEIAHPVLNDHQMEVWQLYGVRAWPTVFLIDPTGKVIGHASGEGVFTTFDPLIAGVIKTFAARGQIDRQPLALERVREIPEGSPLAFPGKVLADEASGRLYIADSNHNRILVADLDGKVLEVIGSGSFGLDDGHIRQATFGRPQGLALDGMDLYVADTENHAIRRVDLAARTVTTLAGTGEQGGPATTRGAGPETRLNSPWDLLLHEGVLYIAMAGAHQIWSLDLEDGTVAPYAGSGREARIDGPVESAALAQPSGLATDGTWLYVADSEVSSIRAVGLPPKAGVKTIAGGDLFDYGDRDGRGTEARLQHPLGVAHADGHLYVADTYNNKIRRIRLSDQHVEGFAGSGAAGREDGAGNGARARFDEPGGVSIAGGKLYVADTNNHAIRVVELPDGRVSTLEIRVPEEESVADPLHSDVRP